PLVGDVGLATEDRLHAGLLGALIKVDRPEQVPVLGGRYRRHAELLHPRAEVGHVDRSVEEAVLRVEVEMNEIRHTLWLTLERPQEAVVDHGERRSARAPGPDHWKIARFVRPLRSNTTPSFFKSRSCTVGRCTSPLAEIRPAALMTRCQGTSFDRARGRLRSA